MKKYHLLLPAICTWLAVVVTSCSNDDTPFQPSREDYVTYTFQSQTEQTRASVDETNYTFRWDQGDQVSIYMGNDADDARACTFTTDQGGNGSASFSYTGPAMDHAYYTGFYPSVNNPTDKNPLIEIPATGIVQSEPNNSTHLKAYRAMYTQTVWNHSEGTQLVNLQFRPLTGLLIFCLKNESDQTVSASTVQLKASDKVFYTRAHYAIGSEATTATPDESSLTESITLTLGDNGFKIAPHTTVKAFLPILPTRSLKGTNLTASINGTDVFWMDSSIVGDADGNKITDLAAGRYYTFNLDVPQTNESSPRIQWVKGITPPNDNEWLKNESETAWYLPYNEKYGWTDVNKVDGSNTNPYDLADGNLCWAASASNLLHWWMNQNHDYIERYKKILERRGETFNAPSAQFPSENFLNGKQKQESDIMQLFTNAFMNYAGYGEKAINWFISGDEMHGQAKRDPDAPYGFFKDVFPEGKYLGKSITGNSKEIFNQTIKDALDNGKAIGFSAVYSSGIGHAMTIWGVEYDSEGVISAIYYADNNDDYLSAQAGCIRKRVRYLEIPVSSTVTTTSVQFESSVTGIFFPIRQLFSISLGQEQWEEYLRNNE